MKTILISLIALFAFCICGCQSNLKQVELTEDIFFSTRFNASDVIEVNLVSTRNTADWTGIYRNVFPVSDANRIKTIINCIVKGGSFSVYADKRVLLIEVSLVSRYPADREKTHTNLVSVKDPTQINTIIDCVRKDREIVGFGETDGIKLQYNKIIFKTPRTVYYTGIRWDDEMVYGDWWESLELRKAFKLWGIQ